MKIQNAVIFEAIRTRDEGEHFNIRLSDKSEAVQNNKFYN